MSQEQLKQDADEQVMVELDSEEALENVMGGVLDNPAYEIGVRP